MQLISTEEARSFVDEYTDGHDKAVDSAIVETLTRFVRVAKALGFETFQSCEGHLDWGNPYPWIDFLVPCDQIPLTPLWKVWHYRTRMYDKRHNKRHELNTEEKVDQLCSLFTKLLVQFDRAQGCDPETVMCIKRTKRFVFRLMPARPYLFDGYKVSGDYLALNNLIEKEREVLASFSSFCVETFEREDNFVGVPDDGCKGCMGRG